MIWIMFDHLFVDIPGATVLHVEADEPVFRQGDGVHSIFQVREGAVAMVRHLSDGTMLTIATASAGETFAEAALFSDRYHCDAVARCKSVIAAAPVAVGPSWFERGYMNGALLDVAELLSVVDTVITSGGTIPSVTITPRAPQ